MRHLLHLLTPLALASACFLGGNAAPPPPGSDDGGSVPLPFQADTPATYVAKVKNVLTGLPPLQSEIDQVAGASDPRAALIALIDGWMTTPEYAAKMLRFFQLALQQTQITKTDFAMMIPQNDLGDDNTVASLIVQNASESMARTMLELIAEGKPLTEAMTTHQFMMTPPLMELYAFMDTDQPNDDDQPTDAFQQANQGVTIVVEDTEQVPLSDTLNPKSPNYMRWYFKGLSTDPKDVDCQLHERDYKPSSPKLHDLLYGTVPQYSPSKTVNCGAVTDEKNGYLTQDDFSSWKMVTIRPPQKGEATTTFYDPNAIKSASELVLNTPRVGFFTTPAFAANWQTNVSNSMRVTLNQALIVATGMQVDGTDATPIEKNPPGLDQEHASTPDCYGCHQYLDPTRSILQATYSDNYGQQTDPNWSQKGLFAFQGVVDTNIVTIDDLARNLATHPKVASAWVEKLCYYANSEACAADDPEFQSIVASFQSSGFSWKTLVEQLLSSPIVTNATESRTADEQGELVSITRLDHLCALLDSRFGLDDVCGLDLTKPAKSGVPIIAAGLPSDGYGRGAPVPVLPTQPTMFLRAGAENICEIVAQTIIDNPKAPTGAKTYSSATQQDVTAAIADFVSTLMALESSDPRASQAVALLAAHDQSALTDPQNPASPTDALRSTFTVACLSPSVLGIGM